MSWGLSIGWRRGISCIEHHRWVALSLEIAVDVLAITSILASVGWHAGSASPSRAQVDSLHRHVVCTWPRRAWPPVNHCVGD